MRRWWVFVVVGLLWLGAQLPAQAETASGICDEFMSAMKSHAYEKAYSFFSKKLQAKMPEQGWLLTYTTYGSMFVIEHWTVQVEERGDQASGKIQVTSVSNNSESNQDNKVELIKEDGEWRISSYKPN